MHFEKKWILITQILFTFNAGYMNLLTFHSCYELPSSHITGLITRMGLELYVFNTQIFFIVFGNFLMYLFGTIGSGYFLSMTDFVLMTCHYYAVIAEILLIVIIYFGASNCLFVLLLSTLTLGLQNGITSSISNNTLRSTHFTGMITDVGICIGQIMKKDYNNTLKFKLWIASLCSYFLGCLIALFCIQYISQYVYLVNIVVLTMVLINWKIFFHG
jgi:uncharacterized membrane protein YoaK (UPF0700 family)